LFQFPAATLRHPSQRRIPQATPADELDQLLLLLGRRAITALILDLPQGAQSYDIVLELFDQTFTLTGNTRGVVDVDVAVGEND